MMKSSFLGKIMDNLRSFFKRIFGNNSSRLPTLRIAMLGPSGVGKTSLLAAMYDQFENVSQDLQITPHKETKILLDPRLKELKNFVQDKTIKVGDGVRPDNIARDIRSFMFDFGETGASPAFSLEFQDYPGEFINRGNPEQLEKIKKVIQNSVVIIIPIDTPALIERNGKHHEDFNKTQKVYELCKYFYQNSQEQKLIIFAPVKCEEYIHDPENLRNQVKKGYSKLFNQLNSDRLLKEIAVVITPVQTVGSARFSRIEYDENQEPILRFIKQDATDNYQPKYSEQPLRYLFRFLIKLYIKQKHNNRLSRLFSKRDSSLQDAIKKFADKTNISDVSVVVQGSNLLEL